MVGLGLPTLEGRDDLRRIDRERRVQVLNVLRVRGKVRDRERADQGEPQGPGAHDASTGDLAGLEPADQCDVVRVGEHGARHLEDHAPTEGLRGKQRELVGEIGRMSRERSSRMHAVDQQLHPLEQRAPRRALGGCALDHESMLGAQVDRHVDVPLPSGLGSKLQGGLEAQDFDPHGLVLGGSERFGPRRAGSDDG